MHYLQCTYSIKLFISKAELLHWLGAKTFNLLSKYLQAVSVDVVGNQLQGFFPRMTHPPTCTQVFLQAYKEIEWTYTEPKKLVPQQQPRTQYKFRPFHAISNHTNQIS